MPRNARIDLPGYPRHICIRAVDGMPCLVSDLDRNVFLEYLREAMEGREFELHAFVLMINHVHLLATSRARGVMSKVMHSVGLRYARYFNRYNDRRGPVFQGRYWSSIIETERYFFEAMRYIELNPVRACLVESPAHFPWSSHLHNVGRSHRDEITFHSEFLLLGSTAAERARAWEGIVAEGIRQEDLQRIRTRFRRSHPLGSESFEKRLGTGIGDGSGEPSPKGVPT
jgi:putative transposase